MQESTAQLMLHASDAVYGNVNEISDLYLLNNGWEQFKEPIVNPDTGFYAQVYNKGNEYIVAFKGSSTFKDALADITVGKLEYNTGIDLVMSLLRSLPAGAKINFTGHSLGGALAEATAYTYMGEQTHVAASNVQITTFNGLGGQQILNNNGTYDPSRLSGVTNTAFVMNGDVISTFGVGHFGATILQNGVKQDPYNAHVISTFFNLGSLTTFATPATISYTNGLEQYRQVAATVATSLAGGNYSQATAALATLSGLSAGVAALALNNVPITGNLSAYTLSLITAQITSKLLSEIAPSATPTLNAGAIDWLNNQLQSAEQTVLQNWLNVKQLNAAVGDALSNAFYDTAAATTKTMRLLSESLSNIAQAATNLTAAAANAIETTFDNIGKNLFQIFTDVTNNSAPPDTSGTIVAGAGNDTVTGTTANDLVYGEAGNDVFFGSSAGNDILIGNGGMDTVSYEELASGVTIRPIALFYSNSLTYAVTKAAGADTVMAERIIGTKFADTFYASVNGNDYFVGNGGNDKFYLGYGLTTSVAINTLVGGGSLGGGVAIGVVAPGTVSDSVYGYHAGETTAIDGSIIIGATQGSDGIFRSGTFTFNPSNSGLVVTAANGSTVAITSGALFEINNDFIRYGGPGGITLTRYKDANGNPLALPGNPSGGDSGGLPGGAGSFSGAQSGATNGAETAMASAPYLSPIILDLNRDGVVQTLSRANGTYFDLDHNGFAEKTGWVGGADGLLVWDRNGNGKIDNGSELFGNQALRKNGTVASDGFDLLNSYDDNLDGTINGSDTLWSKLKLWVDTNHNGITDAGELKTLASYGINGLSTLAYNDPYAVDTSGNHPLFSGSYTRTDGSSYTMSDVFFATDTSQAMSLSWVATTPTIDALPDLMGKGTVYSLHQAMARDTSGTLTNLVKQFTTQTTIAARNTTIEQLIQRWTGTQSIAINSRNSNGGTINARHLAALEAFQGAKYIEYGLFGELGIKPNDPTSQTAPQLEAAYKLLSEKLYAQLAAQSFLKPFYDKIVSSSDATGTHYDFTAALAALFSPTIPAAQQHDIIVEFYRTIFASGLTSDQVNYASLMASLTTNRPAYVAEVNTLTQIYYQGAVLTSNRDGSTITGTLGDDTFYGNTDTSGNPVTSPNTFYGNGGNDTIFASNMGDTIYGGDGNDTITAGMGADKIYGGAGDDYVIETNQYGSVKDILNGGAGSNSLEAYYADISPNAISGFQTLYADGTTLTAAQLAGFSKIISDAPDSPVILFAANAGTYNLKAKTLTGIFDLYGSSGNDTLIGANTTQNLYGGEGNDTLTAGTGPTNLNGGNGNDTLNGGAGNDTLSGGGGADKMYGNGGNDTFVIDVTKLDAGTIIDGGIGVNTLQTYGSDISLAAITNVQNLDATIGYARLTAAQLNGFTALAGTIQAVAAGTYSLVGKTISSPVALIGSVGDDILTAGAVGVTLDGDKGNNTLNGGAGNDRLLVSNAGINLAYGNGGDDIFAMSGSVAGEIIDGGTGANTVEGSGNISLATISNVQTLKLYATSATISAAQFSSFGNLIGAGYTNYGNVILATAGTYSLVGKTITGSITLTGSAGDDILTASAIGAGLDGGAGNNTLNGGVGNDTLTVSSLGINKAYGNGGNDTFVMSGSVAGETIDGGAGANTIKASGNISLAAISNVQTLAANYITTITLSAAQLAAFTTLTGPFTIAAAAAGTYSLAGKTVTGAINLTGAATGNNTLIGNAAAQNLTGGAGNDTLDGAGGADNLIGGLGNDTYAFGRTYGADTITENDATLGNTDIVNLGAGITRDQLWFTHTGNDLVMKIIGTTDSVTVKNWYSGTANHVEQIKTADGHMITDAKVQNLVNAMAALTPPATTTLSTAYHTQLDPVIAANWS